MVSAAEYSSYAGPGREPVFDNAAGAASAAVLSEDSASTVAEVVDSV